MVLLCIIAPNDAVDIPIYQNLLLLSARWAAHIENSLEVPNNNSTRKI